MTDLIQALNQLKTVIGNVAKSVSSLDGQSPPFESSVARFMSQLDKTQLLEKIRANLTKFVIDNHLNLTVDIITPEGQLVTSWLLNTGSKGEDGRPKGHSVFIFEEKDFLRVCIPVSEIWTFITRLYERDDKCQLPYTFMAAFYRVLYCASLNEVSPQISKALKKNYEELNKAIPSSNVSQNNPLSTFGNMLSSLMGNPDIAGGFNGILQNFMQNEQVKNVLTVAGEAKDIYEKTMREKGDVGEAFSRIVQAEPVKNLIGTLASTIQSQAPEKSVPDTDPADQD